MSLGKNKMKILITTGIYPPKIGGPAQYAKNLREAFEKLGHNVSIKTYGFEYRLPTGVRHIFFLSKIIPAVLQADVVFALDTFSVGLPSLMACKILNKKCIIRTGGDFLWEQYVERTEKKVLLRNFYNTEIQNFYLKEKIIFKLTKWTLHCATHTIFSTDWQRKIFIDAYHLKKDKTSIIENYYGHKESDEEFRSVEFVGSTRKLVWKNLDMLQEIFVNIKRTRQDTDLFLDNLPFGDLMDRMKKSYAVILISMGDISPNMILDAIRFNRPFICTKEVGIYERIKDAGIFVDPLNKAEIESAISHLLTTEGYKEAKEKVRNFNFVHTWGEIAEEFIKISTNI